MTKNKRYASDKRKYEKQKKKRAIENAKKRGKQRRSQTTLPGIVKLSMMNGHIYPFRKKSFMSLL